MTDPIEDVPPSPPTSSKRWLITLFLLIVVSIGFMFRAMNFVAENVSNHQLLDETRLEQVFEAMFCGNLLRFANVVDDLRDVIHGLAARLHFSVFVVERTG